MARLWLGAAIALALLLTFASPAQADVKASASGAWSDHATWGGSVPGADDAVTIPGRRTVTVDTAARARRVQVAEGGTLAFAEDKSSSLELRGNLVVEGTLQMVAPDPGVQQAIRFVGVDEGAFRGGGHEVKSAFASALMVAMCPLSSLSGSASRRTVAAWPMWRASKSQSTMLVMIVGPSASVT